MNIANTSLTQKRNPPIAFGQYSQGKFKHTVELTRKAITKLETESKTVTLEAVCEATRELDTQGKGLRPITVLRNSEAAELFRQHSPAYQARQQKVGKAKRKRSKINSDVRTTYRGLRVPDLIQMVEDLKAQIAERKIQHDKLKTERDEAYRLRDEALQQNTRQLATLTKLGTKIGHRRRK